MKLINKLCVGLALTAMIFGCTSDSNNANQQVNTNKENIATPIGKPSAPITMNYSISKENLKPGDEFTIELSFQTKFNSSISVQANSFKKLTLLNDQKNWQSNITKSGEREALPPLNLIATENGTFYLKLMASVIKDGEVISKPFVVPVVVGDGSVQLRPVGRIITDDKGQKIIIQKADANN